MSLTRYRSIVKAAGLSPSCRVLIPFGTGLPAASSSRAFEYYSSSESAPNFLKKQNIACQTECQRAEVCRTFCIVVDPFHNCGKVIDRSSCVQLHPQLFDLLLPKVQFAFQLIDVFGQYQQIFFFLILQLLVLLAFLKDSPLGKRNARRRWALTTSSACSRRRATLCSFRSRSFRRLLLRTGGEWNVFFAEGFVATSSNLFTS